MACREKIELYVDVRDLKPLSEFLNSITPPTGDLKWIWRDLVQEVADSAENEGQDY